MIVGNYNFHQILFALDTFGTVGEKIGYLESIKNDIGRIIECFETRKTLPLKMYASNNMSIEGNCDELKIFIKHQFDIISSNPYDKRYPGEGELRGLLRSELINYQKLYNIVEDELNSTKKVEVEKKNSSKSKDEFVTLERLSPHNVAKLLNKLNGGKIIWNSSIGELIDLIKIMIVLELIEGLEESQLPKFIVKNFVDDNKEKYKVHQIEKVHKMLQNTFWLNSRNSSPKFFQ